MEFGSATLLIGVLFISGQFVWTNKLLFHYRQLQSTLDIFFISGTSEANGDLRFCKTGKVQTVSYNSNMASGTITAPRAVTPGSSCTIEITDLPSLAMVELKVISGHQKLRENMEILSSVAVQTAVSSPSQLVAVIEETTLTLQLVSTDSFKVDYSCEWQSDSG